MARTPRYVDPQDEGLVGYPGDVQESGPYPSLPPDPYSDEALGLAPLELMQDPGAEEFDPGALGGFLERFGSSFQGIQNPSGFAQGLASGLAGSLAGRGQQIAKKRAKFEASQAEAKKTRDAYNVKASQDYRDARAKAVAGAKKDAKEERRREAELDISHPKVTEAHLNDMPWLARSYKVGQRAPAATLNQVPDPIVTPQDAERDPSLRSMIGKRVPASRLVPERGETPAQAAARERQAASEARADAQAIFGNEAKLTDDYNTNPAVKSYSFLRDNLKMAKEGIKRDTGVGDQMIIFAFGRAREPQNPNVFREGEYSTVQSALGKFESLKNLPAYYISGNRLSERGRREMMAALRDMTSARRTDFENAVNVIRARGQRGRVQEVDRQFPDYREDVGPGGLLEAPPNYTPQEREDLYRDYVGADATPPPQRSRFR